VRDRSEFAEALSTCDCVEKVFDSGANFLLVRLKEKRAAAQAATEHLLSSHGILMKDIYKKFTDGSGYLRLAVRLPLENMRLVAALSSIAHGAGK
jgi:histidinol-phosphate/aromatic aminotransferase/cobyric acid decarboxylase-like protein